MITRCNSSRWRRRWCWSEAGKVAATADPVFQLEAGRLSLLLELDRAESMRIEESSSSDHQPAIRTQHSAKFTQRTCAVLDLT